MTDLINQLRTTASKGISVWGDLQMEAANRIEALTAERDALKDAARLALDALVFYTDSEAEDYQYKPAQDAINALKAVL